MRSYMHTVYKKAKQGKSSCRTRVWSTPAEGKDRNCCEENAHDEGHDRPSELGQDS